MKFRVKSTIPSEKKPGNFEKWNFWVYGSNLAEATSTAEAKLERMRVGTSAGVINCIRPNKGIDLKGGIGDMPIYKGV